MQDGEVFIAALSIFAIFIALPGMVLYFLSRNRETAVKNAGDPTLNASLMNVADRLEQRLDSIETLLDHEVPGWRKPLERRNV